MSVIRILPYILVVVIFDMVYWVTLIIPNNLLYLGLMQNWNEVVTNNKMPLQKAIFTEGLCLVILCCNAFEMYKVKDSSFFALALKSALTIMFTYATAAIVFKLVGSDVWNLYHYYRGQPAFIFMLATMLISLLGLALITAVVNGKAYLQRV
ncbi:MAG: hypothetical protein KA149_01480 [Chitinophagales bacterium]|nr:hypothetical protein [Chitinophagales bacterium]